MKEPPVKVDFAAAPPPLPMVIVHYLSFSLQYSYFKRTHVAEPLDHPSSCAAVAAYGPV
jgi:hypothetical protein